MAIQGTAQLVYYDPDTIGNVNDLLGTIVKLAVDAGNVRIQALAEKAERELREGGIGE